MTEQQSNGEKKEVVQRVGDLGIEQFFGILLQVLDERKVKGDPRLMEMTVAEFSTKMIEVFKTRAYQTAVAETNTAERILTDWQGLQSVEAVAQPFRVRTAEEAIKFGQELAQSFSAGSRAELVVAVAVVGPEGGYRPHR